MECKKIEIEKFVDIPGYEGLYRVSNFGNIKSYDRAVNTVHQSKRVVKGKFIKTRPDSRNKYLIIDLSSSKGERATKLVHRIVAKAFLGDIDGMEINHKDGNPKNNNVSNLEITTRTENEIHKYRVLKRKHPFTGKTGKNHVSSIPVEKVDLKTGEVLQTYESARLAESDGFESSCISLCCNGRQKRHKGYAWRFKK